ncbi:uncharacterized protein METZ01_LOCUS511176, partial [marine metagenome]
LWDELDEFLLTKFKTQDGRVLPIAATCVDSGGHWTQSVYAYTRNKGSRRVWAIKGQSVAGKPIANRPSTVGRMRVALYPIGTDACKEWVFSRLNNDTAPAVFHFSHTLDEEYFEQLAASERRVEKFERGVKRLKWVQIRERNECLDTACYGLAAIYILNPNWSKLGGDHDTDPEPPKPERPPPAIRRPPRGRPRRWLDIR